MLTHAQDAETAHHGRRSGEDGPAPAASTSHGRHDGHAGRAGHDQHAGHDPAAFRRRFWLTAFATIPLVVTSHMVMEWFGYTIDFRGMRLLGPVLGSF
ncbi:MAG: hypothetical protein AB7H92_19365, partial [Microbacteriaceae bacterium]